MADTINVHEAKTHFSKLLQRVEAGESLMLSRAGKPVARLGPVPSARRTRELGRHRDEVTIPEPLPAAVTAALSGGGS